MNLYTSIRRLRETGVTKDVRIEEALRTNTPPNARKKRLMKIPDRPNAVVTVLCFFGDA